jgi:hypothetical protein
LRHLIFATDAWVRRTILGETHPYHPVGLTHTGLDPASIGIDPSLTPTFAEVMSARRDRLAEVGAIVATLDPAEFVRMRLVTSQLSKRAPDARAPLG